MSHLLLDRFLHYLIVEKGLSPNTLEGYSRDLIRYFRFLDRKGISDLSRSRTEDLYEYLLLLKKAQFSPRTQARHLSALKSFHRFLQEEGIRPDNPALPLRGPKPVRGLPKTLSEREVESLIGRPRSDTPTGLRDAALLEVLYATGLRVSELIGLTLDQLDLEAPLIRTKGKGSKERLVPIGRSALRVLTTYLEKGRPAFIKKPGNPWVFLNRRGGRLSRQGVWKILKNYGFQAGITKNISPPHA